MVREKRDAMGSRGTTLLTRSILKKIRNGGLVNQSSQNKGLLRWRRKGHKKREGTRHFYKGKLACVKTASY